MSLVNVNTIKHLPGVCNRCGKILSDGTSKYSQAASYEIEEAKLIAEILMEEGNFSGHDGPIAERISCFIKEAVKLYAEGNYASFSRMIGVAKNVMHGYIHGLHIPTFPVIVRMARLCRCPISTILLGGGDLKPHELIPFDDKKTKPKRESRKYSLKQKARIRRQLEIFSELPTPISLTQIAATLKVSDKFLSTNFPDLTAKIGPKYLEHCRNKSEEKFRERCEQIRQAAKTLCRIGVRPNIRSLRTYMKGSETFFGERIQAAVKTISLEVIEQSRSMPTDRPEA